MDPLAFAEHPATDLAVLVSPAAGRFRGLAGAAAVIGSGGLLGHVTGAGTRAAVSSPNDTVVDGLLVRTGQTVAAGQVLAWGRRCRLEALT